MKTVTYATSLLMSNLKGEITIEDNMIRFDFPRTILGLIKTGDVTDSVAVNQIASTRVKSGINFKELILGGLGVLAGLKDILAGIVSFNLFIILFAAIILVVSVSAVADAFQLSLEIATTSGQIKAVDFLYREKQTATDLCNEINGRIVNRMDDTNTRIHADRIIDAINAK